MIVARLIFSFFRSFLSVGIRILYNPWYVFKISFLWFLVMLAASYIYFLWTHQGYLVEIRRDLIALLAKSLWVGLLCSLGFVGIYEFILQMMCASKFFLESKHQLCSISLLEQDMNLSQVIGFFEVIFASFWACVYIEPFLQHWYANRIVHGYHWLIIAATVVCLGFLALIIF
ncbi:hypothetical protein HYV10_02140 [Candidatus Dependentiae bacterium]|nr:hypothetical protein [Candidatus Dependentiae bacterium]